MKILLGTFALFLLGSLGLAAPKSHSVALGKWTSVKWVKTEDEPEQPTEVKIRALVVDGRVKELTTGTAHDVTDRAFVVQRVYRLNDSLPQETGAAKWEWQPGAWLLVDRVSGKVQAITLPEFDPYTSSVNWFRDYAAYCGTAEDGKKVYAIVAQLGRRKPLLKRPLADTPESEKSNCGTPTWQRHPARVTFDPRSEPKFSYSVRSRAVDLVAENDDESAGD